MVFDKSSGGVALAALAGGQDDDVQILEGVVAVSGCHEASYGAVLDSVLAEVSQ